MNEKSFPRWARGLNEAIEVIAPIECVVKNLDGVISFEGDTENFSLVDSERFAYRPTIALKSPERRRFRVECLDHAYLDEEIPCCLPHVVSELRNDTTLFFRTPRRGKSCRFRRGRPCFQVFVIENSDEVNLDKETLEDLCERTEAARAQRLERIDGRSVRRFLRP